MEAGRPRIRGLKRWDEGRWDKDPSYTLYYIRAYFLYPTFIPPFEPTFRTEARVQPCLIRVSS